MNKETEKAVVGCELFDVDAYQDRLTHSEVEDAIDCYLDGTEDNPDSLVVHGFKRRKWSGTGEEILEYLLDQDFFDPDEAITDQVSDGVEEAANLLAKELKEWKPWGCWHAHTFNVTLKWHEDDYEITGIEVVK